MAYSTSTPPVLMVPSIGAKPQLWTYSSTHTSTNANATGFFTNGQNLGMRVPDIVLIVPSTGGVLPAFGVVTTVTSTGVTVATT